MLAKCVGDYFTFTVRFQSDPDLIITDFLGMDPALFQQWEGSVLPYFKRSKVYGNIHVCFDAIPLRGAAAEGKSEDDLVQNAADRGISITMSGNGCRQFEQMSVYRNNPLGAMDTLLHKIYENPDCKATRFDLACDDRSGILDIDVVREYAYDGSFDSRMRAVNLHDSKMGTDDLGKSIYIGSEKSDLRVRIYDKAKQMYAPNEPEYGKPWIRVELVLRGKNADGFVAAYCNSNDLGELASGILADKLRFIERDDSNITRCSTAQWWLDFVGAIEAIKLFQAEPVKHTLDRAIQWMTYQISPSLAMAYKALGWTGLKRMLEYGDQHMSARHRAILADYEQRRHIPNAS